IKADNSDVTVRTGTTPQLRRTERWTFERPHVDIATDNGVMTATVRCPYGLFNRCSVDIDAAVPPKANVSVRTTNGDVGVNGVTEDAKSPDELSVQTHNGDITITGR